jgi:hypothetical protein
MGLAMRPGSRAAQSGFKGRDEYIGQGFPPIVIFGTFCVRASIALESRGSEDPFVEHKFT